MLRHPACSALPNIGFNSPNTRNPVRMSPICRSEVRLNEYCRISVNYRSFHRAGRADSYRGPKSESCVRRVLLLNTGNARRPLLLGFCVVGF
jgi:hypothetical protein